MHFDAAVVDLHPAERRHAVFCGVNRNVLFAHSGSAAEVDDIIDVRFYLRAVLYIGPDKLYTVIFRRRMKRYGRGNTRLKAYSRQGDTSADRMLHSHSIENPFSHQSYGDFIGSG
jgi:hypothetical protein